MIFLLAFLALGINVGRLMRTRGDLQAATDSAALAAAALLDSKPDTSLGRYSTDVTPGSIPRLAAQSYAAKHRLTTGAFASVDPVNDVRFGFWHHVTEPCVFCSGTCDGGTFEDPLTACSVDPKDRPFLVSAVRVLSRYTVPTIFDGIIGRGGTVMSAESIALTRRARAKCPMPVATPLCRPFDQTFTAERLEDADGTFSCTGQFDDSEYSSGSLNSSAGPDHFSFGRVDIRGTHDPIGDPTMDQFVRATTAANDTQCAGEDYEATTVMMPTSTQTSLRPLVDGLLGIETLDGPKTRACNLGILRVIPVVKPPSCGAADWPGSSGSGLVVGYVSVVFRWVRCTDGTKLSKAADMASHNTIDCQGNLALVEACTRPVGGTDGQLRVRVEVYCEPPTGPGGLSRFAAQPRLVR